MFGLVRRNGDALVGERHEPGGAAIVKDSPVCGAAGDKEKANDQAAPQVAATDTDIVVLQKKVMHDVM